MTLLGLIAFFLVVIIVETSGRGQAAKVKDFLPPPPAIEHYSFGMKPQFADLFWIRAIQDLDYCEEKLKEHLCKSNSWVSSILLTVVRLDPDYKPAYFNGGLALTVLVSDYEGASKLFDLGTARFPTDWKLTYAAAYHALYEEKNHKKAADLYLLAGQHGAPEWVLSLANRLYVKAGEKGMSAQILPLLEKVIQDEEMLRRMRDRILEVESQQ